MAAALLDAGVPAMSLQPAASAVCRGGALVSLATGPINVRTDERPFSERALNRTVRLAECCLYRLPCRSASVSGMPAENAPLLQRG